MLLSWCSLGNRVTSFPGSVHPNATSECNWHFVKCGLSNTDVSIWLIVPRCCRFSFSTLVLRQCDRSIHYRWHFFPCLLRWQASVYNLHQHWFNIAVVADELLVPKLTMLTSGDPLDREDQQVLLSTRQFCSGIPCPCPYAKVYWWFWYCMVVFNKVRTINSV